MAEEINGKSVKKRTYKLWVSIEEHIEFEDGSDEYKDIEYNTVSAGKFDTLCEAELRMNLISETFERDFTED